MRDGTHSPSRHGLLVAGALLAALPAVANESAFSFMMHERYVNGKNNGVTHGLSAGTLSVSIEVETSQCEAKGLADLPVVDLLEVTIEVWEEGLLDKLVCTFNITPPGTPGKKVFSTPCRSVPSAVFHVVAHREKSERCAISAVGRLVTK